MRVRADVAELVDAHSPMKIGLRPSIFIGVVCYQRPRERSRAKPDSAPKTENTLATMRVRADVAELVDAHGSGPCGGNPVEVQVLSSALS